jgi:uncharacterized protein YkwD
VIHAAVPSRRALLGALLVAACASEPRADPGPRTPTAAALPAVSAHRGITYEPYTVALAGPHAPTYGVSALHRLNAGETALAKRLAPLAIERSDALSKVAREIARTAPDRSNVPAGQVDAIMAWAGLPFPGPRLLLADVEESQGICDDRPSEGCLAAIDVLAREAAGLLEQLQAEIPRSALTWGVGVAPSASGGTRLVVAVLERGVSLEPLDVTALAGGSVRVRGRLQGGRTAPRIERTEFSGAHGPVPALVGDDGSFEANVACPAEPGPVQIEVLADGRYGPGDVVALFPIWCGNPPPTTLELELERVAESVSANTIARANFEELNREREARGLQRLLWADDAATVALAHSRDMVEHGFFGHDSPTTGDPSDRFRAAKVQAAVVRENLARGYGPRGMHASLLASPGHRANMLADDVTHVGIGVVIAPRESPAGPRPMYVTQNFLRRPGAGAPTKGDLTADLQARATALRAQQGRPPLVWDGALNELAQRVAQAMAGGAQEIPPKLGAAMQSTRYARVDARVLSASDYDTLARDGTWLELANGPGRGLGVGVARRGREQPGFVVVVMIGHP